MHMLSIIILSIIIRFLTICFQSVWMPNAIVVPPTISVELRITKTPLINVCVADISTLAKLSLKSIKSHQRLVCVTVAWLWWLQPNINMVCLQWDNVSKATEKKINRIKRNPHSQYFHACVCCPVAVYGQLTRPRPSTVNYAELNGLRGGRPFIVATPTQPFARWDIFDN